MKKKVLWKDSLQAITGSLGRFIAIFLLVMLGTFTLIGLKSSGPDMRQPAIEFYKKHSLADITVTSNYGLDNKDIHTIKTQKNIKRVDLIKGLARLSQNCIPPILETRLTFKSIKRFLFLKLPFSIQYLIKSHKYKKDKT